MRRYTGFSVRIYLRHGRIFCSVEFFFGAVLFDNINHCGVLQIKHYILCVPHPFLVAGTTYCSMFLLKRKGISCKFLFSEYCILLFRADRNLHFSNSFCKRSFKNGLGRAGQKDLIFRPVPCNEKPAAAQFYGSFSLRKTPETIAATAAAHAPVPQDSVSPLPRSQTLIFIVC